MNPQFENPEDIDRRYAREIELETDPGRKAELRVQAAEAKIALKERDAQQRMVGAWKRLALIEYPHAGKFPELVVGNTEEEIREAAQAAHQRVEEMMRGAGGSDDTFERARQAYGPGPTTGGNVSAPSAYTPPNMAEERWNMNFAQRFNEAPRDAYGQRQGISSQEITRYTNNRFIQHVKDRLNFWADMTRSDAGHRRR